MNFSEMTTSGPPETTQLEVCVFGPSYGECIVIHMGGGEWVIIDSCIVGGGEPVALAYLRALKVDPAAAIRAVIVTHWHDDHCRGASKIIKAAPAAHICISTALTEKEFFTFTYRMLQNRTAIAGPKLHEFDSIINEIRQRKKAGLSNFSFATVRKSIFGVPPARYPHGQACEIVSLSPSDADTITFLDAIGAMMPQSGATKRAVSSITGNEVSVGAVVTVGSTVILLGADVENSGSGNSGWEGILTAHRERSFADHASLFKISHHGSETSYNPEIWQSMVHPDAYSVLTPWQRGRGRLPTQEGVRKILSHTHNAFTTAMNTYPAPAAKKRPLPVVRQLRESGIKLRGISSGFGAVRFRTRDFTSKDWNVELFGGADQLSKILVRPSRQAR